MCQSVYLRNFTNNLLSQSVETEAQIESSIFMMFSTFWMGRLRLHSSFALSTWRHDRPLVIAGSFQKTGRLTMEVRDFPLILSCCSERPCVLYLLFFDWQPYLVAGLRIFLFVWPFHSSGPPVSLVHLLHPPVLRS